ncbi:flagellar basal-body rod protein FlgG [Paenibacillus endophyticus]|uniref:Flagellar basal-body rod protein FlgG n=1 Tax=Paenibacillus endophyticus TaxID=1294268 RepID=A0A7W5GC97_9BACL|nr:flagellar hook-basal body protein [Paenibacillus endophyticus]MBB3154600.1 flagellar basal-body rod protein FlgG [Paenibacillus endophyticus]
MLRGLYTAASGMISQQRRHDTVTNNISNINTPGYKQTNAVTRSFPEMMLSLTGAGQENYKQIGKLTNGVFAEESLSIHLQGDLTQTNNSSDFALLSNIELNGLSFDASGKYVDANGEVTYQPQAFFTLQDQNGEVRYTRGGKFTLTEEGFLMGSDGSSVLGTDGQPIQMPAGVGLDRLMLTSDQRFVDADGQDIGVQLLISRVDNPNQLIREGNGSFRFGDEEGEAVAIVPGERIEVRQGYIERSNVDAAQAAVDLMSALRAYEANQKVIQFYDQSLSKAVNDVGRV